jgi:shikimate kinase
MHCLKQIPYNMGQFLPRFDHIILLRAPIDVIVERLRNRTNNRYGKHLDEVARVLDLLQTVEPLLRRAATQEIDPRVSVDEVVAAVLRLVQWNATV